MRHIDKDYQKVIDERIKFNLHMAACHYPSLTIVSLKGSVNERVEQVMSYFDNLEEEND